MMHQVPFPFMYNTEIVQAGLDKLHNDTFPLKC